MTIDIAYINNGQQVNQAMANLGFNAMTSVSTVNPLPIANGVEAFQSIPAGSSNSNPQN